MSDGRDIWLKKAHAEFAKHGDKSLKIESLAKLVGKARSSFYHLFGDLEEFTNELIQYDLEMTSKFAEETKELEVFFPDYAEKMVKYKDMLFFNKQIFLGRKTNKLYDETWNQIASRVDDKAEVLWMKLVNLEELPAEEKEQFYLTIRTAAFMRLQYDTYTYENIFKVVTDVNSSFGFLLGKEEAERLSNNNGKTDVNGKETELI